MSIRRRISGTGKDGRLTKDDVIAAAEAQKAGAPGAQRRRRKLRLRRRSAGAAGPALRPRRASAAKSASR